MLGWWSLVRAVHVFGAIFWVGGELVISAVLLPVVRRRLEPALGSYLLGAVGRRFAVLTVAAFLPLQVITGLALAWHKGVTIESLADPGYGRILAAKLVAFSLVMIAAGGHGWAMADGKPVLARSLAIGSLFGSLVVVVLATALATA
jgi:uncharacterized membrane protein